MKFLLTPLLFISLALFLSTTTRAQNSPSTDFNSPQAVKILSIAYYPDEDQDGKLDTVSDMGNRPLTGPNGIEGYVAKVEQDTINALTEGSRFRGYKNTSAPAYLTYSVLDSKKFYTRIPNGERVGAGYSPDYKTILQNLDICDYVDNKGVSQVWFWGYHTKDMIPVESDTSMGRTSQRFWNYATYGDISNSYQTNDLPICQKTYFLFNYNYGRGLGENLEDHGHHLEAIFRWMDYDLFWNRFVGSYYAEVNQLVGPSINPQTDTFRCGWMHNPPNARHQYDWENIQTVNSDCEDWSPDGSSASKQISCNSWPPYTCPGNTGSSYKVWWFQNLPGYQNSIFRSNGAKLRNWWEFYANFDAALDKGFTLTEPRSSSPKPESSPSPSPQPIISSSPSSLPSPFKAVVALIMNNIDIGLYNQTFYQVNLSSLIDNNTATVPLKVIYSDQSQTTIPIRFLYQPTTPSPLPIVSPSASPLSPNPSPPGTDLSNSINVFVPAGQGGTVDQITVNPGEEFTAKVSLAIRSDPINLIYLTLDYPKDLLTAEQVITTSSVLNNWIQYTIDKDALNSPNGTITLATAVFNPGYITGTNKPFDLLVEIVFKGKANTSVGNGLISIKKSNTQIYKNSDNSLLGNLVLNPLTVTVRAQSSINQSPTPVATIFSPVPALTPTPTPSVIPQISPQPAIRNGDINKDGNVNLQDLSIVISNVNRRSFLREADINKDGIVNAFDFSLIIKILHDGGILN